MRSVEFESGGVLAEVGDEAFAETAIFDLSLPGSLRALKPGVLAGMGQLWGVRLGEGLEVLESRCFSGTSVKQVQLPASLRKIEPGAFSGCPGLWSVRVPSGSMHVN